MQDELRKTMNDRHFDTTTKDFDQFLRSRRKIDEEHYRINSLPLAQPRNFQKVIII